MNRRPSHSLTLALKVLCAGLSILIAASATAHRRGGGGVGAVDHSIAREIDRWAWHIAEASARFGIPQEWIRRVMRAESGGRTMLNGRPITSSAGAMGLMQLMPGTWAEMRAAHRLGADPHDPGDNIVAGTAYLRTLYGRFGYPGLFAAYHAGPSRYADHLATGRPLPAETIDYLAAVGSPARGPAAARRSAPLPPGAGGSPIFALLASERQAPARMDSSASPSPLFVPLSTALSPVR
jgi:soluble lytic murein transglycosylase-like protein